MRRWAAAVLLATAACGSEAAPAGGLEQTAAYRDWVVKQVPLGVAGGGGTLSARISVLPPEGRSKRSDDFCEVSVNGQRHKLRVGRLADGSRPALELEVKLRPGPNVLDLYDSTSERSCRRSIDTREGLDFVFQPTADGYELIQRATE